MQLFLWYEMAYENCFVTFEIHWYGLKEFDVSDKGNRYTLVFLDYLTKYPEIEIERVRKTLTVTSCLEN